jgi:hypothetical protein
MKQIKTTVTSMNYNRRGNGIDCRQRNYLRVHRGFPQSLQMNSKLYLRMDYDHILHHFTHHHAWLTDGLFNDAVSNIL